MGLGKRKNRSNGSAKIVSQKKTKKNVFESDVKIKSKEKGKMKAFIEIPGLEEDSQEEGEEDALSDNEGDMLDAEVGMGEGAMTFIEGLDQKGITRSRQDQVNENRKNRPKQTRPSKSYSSLPKISNHSEVDRDEEGEILAELDEDDFALGSGSDDDLDLLSDMPSSVSGSDLSDYSDLDSDDDLDSEFEDYSTDDSALEKQYYESQRTKHHSSELDDENNIRESKLPVRLPDGTIQRFPKPAKSTNRAVKFAEGTHMPDSDPPPPQSAITKKTQGDSSLSARFGRKALFELLSPSLSPKNRFELARIEIAELSQEAIADPEMSLSSIKRLFAISSPNLMIPHENEGNPVPIDLPIRVMAILSLLAVFLDIIPGYRIRPLSEAEKQAKVSQMVARQREWEEGLVSTYRRYLEVCEKEVVSSSPLAAVSLKSLCHLLQEKTHFNFSHNIMEVLVRKLGRVEWDQLSGECLESITEVFKKDLKGDNSLQLVRLIGRVIKSRNHNGHPQLLAALLSLRLKDELSSGTRASVDKVYTLKDQSLQPHGKLPWKNRKNQKSKTPIVVMSKKAKKAMKDRAGIEKEIQEAEESVKEEERERNQTETLKLIFALYFRIIKLPYRSNLLPAALEGLSRFSHLVNIDFFRDLLGVLRNHIKGTMIVEDHNSDTEEPQEVSKVQQNHNRECRDKLLCIITAFELLSGQGEALNLDLTDFINSLYAIIIPLGVQLNIDRDVFASQTEKDSAKYPKKVQYSNLTSSNIDLLIQALSLAFLMNRSVIPPIRALAFTKRLLTISLSLLQPQSIIKLMEFMKKLVHKQPTTKNILILSDEDQLQIAQNGLYSPEINDVDLSNANFTLGWEIFVLQKHWDSRVRDSVQSLLDMVNNS